MAKRKPGDSGDRARLLQLQADVRQILLDQKGLPSQPWTRRLSDALSESGGQARKSNELTIRWEAAIARVLSGRLEGADTTALDDDELAPSLRDRKRALEILAEEDGVEPYAMSERVRRALQPLEDEGFAIPRPPDTRKRARKKRPQ